MAAMKKTAGFTLVELLVSLTVFSLVMAGASTFYVVQSSVRLSEQLGLTMEGNLRLAVDRVTFSLRNTGYGAPTSNFSSWMPWVTGFTANPMITAGANAATPAPSLCVLAMTAVLSSPANALYKCATKEGVVYQDRPCLTGTETVVTIVNMRARQLSLPGRTNRLLRYAYPLSLPRRRRISGFPSSRHTPR
jgi:prepilin-type N-terminal cleavage/methylation domain-containing protein